MTNVQRPVSNNDAMTLKAHIRRYAVYARLRFRHDSPIRIVLGCLNAVGIKIQPFYVFVAANPVEGHTPVCGFPDIRVASLTASDMRTIAELPERKIPESVLLLRLENGQFSLGAFHNDRLVAFNWCDLTEFNFVGYRFPLAPDEAYLYDAHTVIPYRGKGLASWLGCRIYAEAYRLGRTRLYSVSERFNTPAVRFERNINGRIVYRGMHVELLNTWHIGARPRPERLRDGNIPDRG